MPPSTDDVPGRRHPPAPSRHPIFAPLRLGKHRVALDGPLQLMGIVNVTPDSFSDGGEFLDPTAAIAQGQALAAAGAAIVDVGGESTRPGAPTVPVQEELRRVMPVLEGLCDALPVPLSIDTRKPAVAAAAIDAGVGMVNDIGGLGDAGMVDLLVEHPDVAAIVMHMQGDPTTMQLQPSYTDVVAEVAAFLRARCDRAVAAGVERSQLVIDPGLGFGKTLSHNLTLLSNLGALRTMVGAPLMVGASRKSFIAKLLGLPADHRDEGTYATSVLAALHGVEFARVHDVAGNLRAVRVAEAVVAVRPRRSDAPHGGKGTLLS